MRLLIVSGVVLLVIVSAVPTFLVVGSAATTAFEGGHVWNYMISGVPAQLPYYPSIGVGSDGKIWVAYGDGSSERYVNVTWYDGNEWHYYTIAHGDFNMVGHGAGAPPIALCMENNIPHIFYYLEGDSGIKGYLNHTYLNGNSWITETIWQGSLMDNTGKPENSISVKYYGGSFYVLFQITGVNYLTSPENGLFLITGNTGSWGSPQQVVLKNSYHWFFGDLAVYNSTKIGIAVSEEFSNINTGEKIYYIQYVEYDGNSFKPIENISSDTNDYVARIAFDSAGNPHIYKGVMINSIGNTYLKEWYKDSTGTWRSDYVDTRENNPGGPMNAELAPNGDIVMAYNIDGQSGIQFSENSEGSWSFEELSDSLSGNAGRDYPSIAFDQSGNIYVAYVNWNNERADKYYIVIATTSGAVPEFGNLLFVLLPLVIIAVGIKVTIKKSPHQK